MVLSLPRTCGSLSLERDQGGSCCGFLEGLDLGSRALRAPHLPAHSSLFSLKKRKRSCLCDLRMGLSWGLAGGSTDTGGPPQIACPELRLREAVICLRSQSCLGAEAELEPRVHLLMEAPDILPQAWNYGMSLGSCGETTPSRPRPPWPAGRMGGRLGLFGLKSVKWCEDPTLVNKVGRSNS